MASSKDNANYEAKRKSAGYVRGPRITAEAAEQLRILAFRNRLTPAEVVTRLLLGIGLCDADSNEQQRLRMGDGEYKTFCAEREAGLAKDEPRV